MEGLVFLLSLLATFQAGLCVLEEEEWEKEIGMAPGKYPKGMSPDGPEWGAPIPSVYPIPEFGIDIPLLPPKYHPGEVIDEMEFSDIDDALDDVMRAGGLMHDRRCAQSTSNEAGPQLNNPQWYLHSGGIHSSPGPFVEPEYTGLNLFLKTPWALRGTVGVVTYDIEGTEFKLAIMWSVPFDRNIYKNWFNFKIYPKSFATNGDMYDQMYYYAGPWTATGWVQRNEFGIQLRGVMTDNIHSKVSLWINSEDQNPDGDPEQWADCSYHAGWFGKYCWRECTPRGWCWVDRRCSSGSDCLNLPLECYTNCKKA